MTTIGSILQKWNVYDVAFQIFSVQRKMNLSNQAVLLWIRKLLHLESIPTDCTVATLVICVFCNLWFCRLQWSCTENPCCLYAWLHKLWFPKKENFYSHPQYALGLFKICSTTETIGHKHNPSTLHFTDTFWHTTTIKILYFLFLISDVLFKGDVKIWCVNKVVSDRVMDFYWTQVPSLFTKVWTSLIDWLFGDVLMTTYACDRFDTLTISL